MPENKTNHINISTIQYQRTKQITASTIKSKLCKYAALDGGLVPQYYFN